jgi:tripartite-type tricarboxylate transporter receptor subunit TctC
MTPRRQFLRSALAASTLPALGPARAQIGGSVSVIAVSFPAGGISDIFARAIAPALATSLGRTFLVENIVGASGSIASYKVLAAKPPGQMLLMGSPTETVLAPATLKAVKYQPTDFSLLGLVSQEPMALYVRGDLPASNIDELIAYARRPGTKPLTYASAGVGSLYHVAGEDFRLASGLELLHVPYKGGTPLLQDLMSGIVDMVLLPTVGDLARRSETGKMKAIAVANTRRHALFPQVQTFAESKSMPGFTTQWVWVGPMVPASTPAAVAAQLHKVLYEALQQAEVRHAIEAAGGPLPPPMSLEQAAAFYRTETQRLRAAVKAAKIEPT